MALKKPVTKKAKAEDEDYEEEEATTEEDTTEEDEPEEEETEEEEEEPEEEEAAADEEEDGDDFRERAKKNMKTKQKPEKAGKKEKPVAKKAGKKAAKETKPEKKAGKVVKMKKAKTERTGPFRPTSTLNEAFEACKAGATEKELTAIAKKGDVAPAWLIGVMKKGVRHDWTWDVADRKGKIVVSGVTVKKGKKAA